MDIKQILKQIKDDYDSAILTAHFNGNRYQDGQKAKEALIRSQIIINYLHNYVKNELIRNGVRPEKIYPPINQSKPEVKIKGFLKSKNQDVTVLPTPEYLEIADTSDSNNEKILSINIRSQLSSLSKNIDTLYERTFAEALNLHLNFPNQCLGEVYLIPTHEYDDKAMVKNKVEFKSTSRIEYYIKMFQAINRRASSAVDQFKYERVCLLIADFRQSPPKLYSDVEEMKADKLIRQDTDVTLVGLTIEDFAEDLLNIYKQRFGTI